VKGENIAKNFIIHFSPSFHYFLNLMSKCSA